MTALIEQAMRSVPRWLLPSVVVAIIGLAMWNQNNERRFVLLENATARNEERNNTAVQLIQRIEQSLIERLAMTRTEDMSHTAQTRTMLITDFEERIATIRKQLEKIEAHLEAIDEKVDQLRDTSTRR